MDKVAILKLAIRLAALLFAALATGGLMVNWIGLARAMARLSASTYTEVHQATNETFDPYMPIVDSGALISGVALAAISRIHSWTGRSAMVGVGCYAAVLAITLPTKVRINKLIAAWSIQAPPVNWAAVRARWIQFHILRTLIAVPALISYL